MAYLNAYNLLTAPRVEPGTTVLTIGATSGVGLATIQIARDLGATVIATTRKRRKAAALRDAGAHHVIVTEEEKLTDRVLELTGGRGVDLALDPVAGPSVADILATTAIGGYVLIYGVLCPIRRTATILPNRCRFRSVEASRNSGSGWLASGG